MSRFRLLFFCGLLAAGAGLPAAAQSQTIAVIKVTGSQRFTAAAIVRASGLHLGEPFTPAAASQAVQKLTATGAFSHIAYLYFPAARGVEVDLKIQDAARFAPAEFDNFVWFTPAQINAALRRALPLYNGEVPAYGGGLDDAVSQQLAQMLAARGIHAQVQYVASVGGAGRRPEVQYSAAGLTIPVAAISFPGAVPALAPALAAAVASDRGSNYSRDVAQGWGLGPARDVYLARGYLEARLGPSEVSLRPGATLSVDVALPVTPGPQYHLAALVTGDPPALAPAQVRRQFDSVVPAADRQPGAVANFLALRRGAQAVEALYRLHGYFSARVSLAGVLNRAQQTVSYRLRAASGPRYAMGQLIITGWPPAMIARLRSHWTLATGQPYDGAYLRQFVVAASRIFRGEAEFMETAHPLTRTVDVTIRPGA